MRKQFLFLSIIQFTFLFAACSPKPVLVQGTAMLPTFHDGDKILINETIGELKRGDVISHLYPKDTSKWYIKRIIDLPGETLEIKRGKVFINGQALDESYIDEKYNQSKSSLAPKIIEENN